MFEVRRGMKYFDKIQVGYLKTHAFCGQNIRVNPDDAFILFGGEGQTCCDRGDKFNKDFGIELAEVRAEINMLKDYEKHLISLTKQPEWRKEKKQEPHLINIDVNGLTPLYMQKLVQSLYDQVKELEQENKSLKDK